MTTTVTTPERLDQYGNFSIATRTLDDDEQVISVNRSPVSPGAWNSSGTWVATDLSGQPQQVRDFAAAHWAAGVVAAFKAANPYVAPVVVDLSALDQSTLNAALAQPGSVVRALALLTFGEINKLRVAGGQQAYTMTQFTAALKAQMR